MPKGKPVPFVHVKTSAINKALSENMGFVQDVDMAEIIEESRLHPCLVRCGNGRFSCPAQDVAHFVKIITEHGLDYVRDVSVQKV